MKSRDVPMFAVNKEIHKNETQLNITKWNPNGPKFTILRSNSNGLRMKITAIPNNKKLTEEKIPVNNNNNHKNSSNHYHQIESTALEKAYVVSHPSSSTSPSITLVDLCTSCTARTDSEGKPITKARLQRKSQYSPKQQKRNHSNQKGECKSKSLLSPDVVSRTSMQAINKSKNSQTKKLNSNTSQIKNINNHDSSVAVGCHIGGPGRGTGIITQTGESISSSDTELPALVSAAIKCVEDCSETENLSSEEVVDPKYTCSLLHDFMLKTEMVGASVPSESKMKRKSSPAVGPAQAVQPVSVATISNEKKSEPIEAVAAPATKKLEIKTEIMTKKQERLEKKKNKEENLKKKMSSKKVQQQQQQNQVNHPPPPPPVQSSSSDVVTTTQKTSPVTEVTKKEVVETKTIEMPLASSSSQKEIRASSSFTNIGISEKHHFNSEKILYPPGGRKASSSSNKHETNNKIAIKPDVDPLWRKIDVNSKFNRPKIAGYKTDGVTPICSKIIAAKSGYLSDVGSGGLNRNSSGYKSDFSVRSRSSTIYSRAKSCDFRRVLEHKSKKLRYKRRAIIKQSKSINSVSEQDILQLAGLSLEQKNHKPAKPTVIATTTTTTTSTQTNMSPNIPILPKSPNSISISSKMKEIDRFIRTGEYFSLTDKSKTTMTTTTTTTTVVETPPPPEINIKPHKRCRDDDTTYDKFHKAKSYYKSTHNGVSSICRRIQSRRYSMISHCSSISTTSKFRSRRRKRQKLKGNRKYCVDSTLSLEIDLLSHLFSFMCLVETDKSSPRLLFDDKTREKLLIQKFSATRILKKRKLIDGSDYDTTNAMAKRRYKKMLHTSSPDEHKLPLKKRHYSLSTGDKYDCKSLPSALDLKLKDISDTKCTSKSSRLSIDKQFMKLCSQKKNHMLESSCSGLNKSFSSRKSRSSMCSELRNVSSSDGEVKTKTDLLTKKKRRLELLVSKLYPSEKSSTDGVKSITPNMMEFSDSSVPSTVFQPTVKLNYSGVRTLDGTQTEPGGDSSTGNNTSHKYTTSNNVKNFRDISVHQTEQMVETVVNKSSRLILVKNKRRRAINRTGFPSVKKRKKKEQLIRNKMDKVHNNHISSPSSYLGSSDKVAIKKENSSATISDNNLESKLSIISRSRLCATPIKNNSSTETVSNNSYSLKQGTSNSTRNRKHDLLVQLEKTTESYLENQPVVKLYNANIDFKNFLYSDSQIDDCSLQDRIAQAKSTRNVRDRNKNIKKVPIIKKIERPRRKLNQDDEKKESPTPLSIPNIKARGATRKIALRAITEEVKVQKNITTPAKNNRSKRNISAIKQADEIEHSPLPLSEKIEETDDDIQKSSRPLSIENRSSNKTKKSFISAGLLSCYYKVNTRTRKAAPEKLAQSMKYPNKPSNSILPPPPYCENFFRKSQYDFQLPYDLWWAYINAKLPIRVPSWNYKKIRTNIYGDVRPNSITDHQACNCKQQTGCKEDCLNRMVYTECSPTNCPCGEKCENQKIQKHDIAAGIERFMTKDKGWGVRTNLPIKKGTYIMEYVGEVVTEREFKQRMATLYANDTHHYCLHLDGVLVIDGHRMGSDGRFVNHSCTPNCEMQKWSVNGLFRMALFALRNIESGEELTYDYNFSLFNPSEGQPCKCDTPHCRGVIGGKSQRIKLPEPMLNPPVSKRYAKRPTSRCHLKELSVDQEKSIAKGNKCFLIRNLEKNKKQKGKLIKSASDSDPTQLSHTPPFYVSTETQVSTIEFLQNMKSKNGLLRVSSRNSEIGRVQKIANLFRQIGLGLENFKEFNSICVAENKRKVKEMKKS